MANKDRLVLLAVMNQHNNIAHKQLHVIIFNTFGFVAPVIAAHIDCHNLIILRKRFYLMPPCILVIQKAVDHHDEWAFPQTCVVNLHPIVVGVAMCNEISKVRTRKRSHRYKEDGR